MGRITAFATRYDVSAQVASSTLAERLPAICGSDTFTTVVSSTSMNVANITEMAMSQGLMTRWGVSGDMFKKGRRTKDEVQPSSFVLSRVVESGALNGSARTRCSSRP